MAAWVAQLSRRCPQRELRRAVRHEPDSTTRSLALSPVNTPAASSLRRHLCAVPLHWEVSQRPRVGVVSSVDRPPEHGAEPAGENRFILHGVRPAPELPKVMRTLQRGHRVVREVEFLPGLQHAGRSLLGRESSHGERQQPRTPAPPHVSRDRPERTR